ncbi:MAG TPA: hypothetical protein VHZ26_08290 [Caulobacteraceae bacterium]|jgi:membrane protein DedA with SNARE-associated domain|nr:hypothetical protein [Caulobacteraceae bacterium]
MLQLLIAYAYPLMIPLSLVEGPMVALAAGVGAAMGRINPFYAYAIVMGGGLFQDVAYYWLGRWSISSARVRAFAQRTRLISKALRPMEEAWRHRMFATLVASKFAYGLYAPILISAGVAKAPFWRFLGQSMALSAVVLAGWLAAGFAFGRAYGTLGHTASWIMAGLGIVALAGLFFIARQARKRVAGQPAGPRERNDPGITALAVPHRLQTSGKGPVMRSILLLFLGVPIPIILLLAMCTHHF